ncbi:MAG: hypothetical protein ACTSRW_02895 [Candidatus Helarchaeota archaeon]
MDIIKFSKIVSEFNTELNQILKNYHEAGEDQEKMRPQVMYYQNVFQDLIMASLTDENLEQFKECLLDKIENRYCLIEGDFTCQAREQSRHISDVKPILEEIIKKKLEEQGKDN